VAATRLDTSPTNAGVQRWKTNLPKHNRQINQKMLKRAYLNFLAKTHNWQKNFFWALTM
jgi:hypothetical protein